MIVRCTRNNINIETPSRERDIEVTYFSYLTQYIQYWTSEQKKNILTLSPTDTVYLNTRLASRKYISPEELVKIKKIRENIKTEYYRKYREDNKEKRKADARKYYHNNKNNDTTRKNELKGNKTV